MNEHPNPSRTIVAFGVTIALTLAACGGDDDSDSASAVASTSPATQAPDSAGPATRPATITVGAQDSDGTTIVVASIDLPAPGFIAVHGDGGGSPGPVIGHSDLLPAGNSTDVVVTLDQALAADSTVFPMAHIDINDNGIYEFAPPDVAIDGPALTVDGEVAVVPAEITVISDDDGDSDAGPAAITIANFAFDGVTEVSIGTTVTVTNADGTRHTWSAADGSFESGTLNPDDTFEFTFTEAGEFEYFCNFHTSMQGTIIVTG